MIGKIGKMNGLAQIPLMIGLLIMAIAIPVAVKLTQTSQDTRSSAAGVLLKGGSTVCGTGIGNGDVLFKCNLSSSNSCSYSSATSISDGYNGWKKVETCKIDCKDGSTTGSAYCVQPAANGATCANDDYCTSGVCHRYDSNTVKCIAKNSITDGSICKDNEECSSSRGCVSGYCGYVPAGKPCLGGGSDCKIGYCSGPNEVCEECTKDSECGTGKKCVIESGKTYHTCLATSTVSTCSSSNCSGCTSSSTCSSAGCTWGTVGGNSITSCYKKVATATPTKKATATPTKKPTATPTKAANIGTLTTNTAACGNKSGQCATFSKTLSNGTSCSVGGKTGTVETGLCGGGSTTVCCKNGAGKAPIATPTKKVTVAPTKIIIPTTRATATPTKKATATPTKKVTATPTKVNPTVYYYDLSERICKTTTKYTSVATCNTDLNRCFSTNALCVASTAGCTARKGTCISSTTTCNGDFVVGSTLCPNSVSVGCCVPKATATPTQKITPTIAATVCASQGRVCATNNMCIEDDFTSTGMGCPTGQVCCTYGLRTTTPTPVIAGCGVCPVGTVNAGKARAAGDSSCDGIINIGDRSIILDEFKAGLAKYGDMNCDGSVNILDFGLWRTAFLTNH